MIIEKIKAPITSGAMGKGKRLSVALGAVAVCSFALCAGLPTSAKADVTDELLQIMKGKGDITDKQYNMLKARHEAEKTALQAPTYPNSGAVPIAIRKHGDYSDAPPPPPPGSSKDGWGDSTYVTALPKGVGVRIGNVDVKVGGDISFFAVEDMPQHHSVTIDGGLLSSGLHNNSNSIRAGLLPSSINVGITTNQNGWDVGAFFGVYTGGNNIDPSGLNANGAGFPDALGTSGVDFRQAYGTVGTPTVGTFKFGRDIGIFGQDAILNDLTLFGSGTPQSNGAPQNTTLGRIGVGYVYADFMPQFSYTTPDMHGFTASAGIFSPLNAFDLAKNNGSADSASITGQESPMVQGRLKYVGNLGSAGCGMKDDVCNAPVKLTLSTSFVVQDHQAENGDFAIASGVKPGDSFTSWGWDGFARIDYGPVSLVGYGYTGSGLGATALFFDGFGISGQARDSSGGYIQGSYTFFNKLTAGGSWGISTLDSVSGDLGTLFKSRESDIGFVRYKLTNWVNLQAEYVHTDEENQIGNTIKDDAVIFGTTFFW